MTPHRRTSRWPLAAGLLTGLLGLITLLGSALAATTPAAPPAPVTPNAACTLTVPADPLSASGLATPYRLAATDPAQGPCHEADPAQSAFVQATVLDPATGALSVYSPLVVDRGSGPASPPVRPQLPPHAVVALWFGFNANTLTLRGATGSGRCVNGLRGSVFGQFAYCNAPAFFAAARRAERSGLLRVPPLGVGSDGAPCPSTRDFGIVDQDQSDNVTTAYLATADGRTAQRTAANAAALGALGATTQLLNGSDNLLLTAFVDPALGCTPWTAPDLADPGHPATSLALDELQAAVDQSAPVALVPLTDPMVLSPSGGPSRAKTDLYRAGVDQPRLALAPGDGPAYCTHLTTVAAARLQRDQALFTAAPSPAPDENLSVFLTTRLAASLTTLGCPTAPASSTSGQPGAAGGSGGGPGTPAAPGGGPAAGASGTSGHVGAAGGMGSGPARPAGSGGHRAAEPAVTGRALDPSGAGTATVRQNPSTTASGSAGPGPDTSAGPASVAEPALAPVGDAVPGAAQLGPAVASPAPGADLHAAVAAAPWRRLWPFAGLGCSALLLVGSARLLSRRRRGH